MEEDRPFLTTGEIVRIAGVHPQTIVMWRYTGKIVPIDQVGSAFLYDRKEVMRFLAERKQGKLKAGRPRKKKREKGKDSGEESL